MVKNTGHHKSHEVHKLPKRFESILILCKNIVITGVTLIYHNLLITEQIYILLIVILKYLCCQRLMVWTDVHHHHYYYYY
jgi:hypothetical protein